MDRDALICAHLPLAGKMAREYGGRGVPIEDLEGEGHVALCRAADDYDSVGHPGVTFAAFAARYIRRAIREAIERSDGVTVCRALKRAAIRCRVAREALFARGNLHPSAEELAEASGLDRALCLEAMQLEESPTPIELFGQVDSIDPDTADEIELVEEVLSGCSELGRAVLTLVGLEGLTIAQAARRLVRPIRDVRRAHDEACLFVADAMGRRGWSPAVWVAAIA